MDDDIPLWRTDGDPDGDGDELRGFDGALYGYNRRQVDRAMAELDAALADAERRLAELEHELEAARAQTASSPYDAFGGQLANLLKSAEQEAAHISAQAREQADALLAQAREQAARLREQAGGEVETLLRRREELRSELTRLYEGLAAVAPARD